MRLLELIGISVLALSSIRANAQYVEKERDDTTRLFATTPFDSIAAGKALAKGEGSIKGVAFTKNRTKDQLSVFLPQRVYANRITVLLFPVTPYLLDYLEIKKKENPKKMKFAYIDPVAWRYRLEAITNSVGEFTFPYMKPGKYYLEAILPWTSTEYHYVDAGSVYNERGTLIPHYEQQSFNIAHYDKLYDFVEIKNNGEVVQIKLK